MMVLFRQTQRESIHDPASIRDIPPEVLGESLYFFVDHKMDLVSASLVCRAWYPVAQRLIVAIREFGGERAFVRRFERFACGLQTRVLVGAESLSVGYLSLNVQNLGKGCAILAPLLSHSLSNLRLYLQNIPSLDCVGFLPRTMSLDQKF